MVENLKIYVDFWRFPFADANSAVFHFIKVELKFEIIKTGKVYDDLGTWNFGSLP